MRKFILLVALLPLLFSCDAFIATPKPKSKLLIYCGITMAHPISEIAALVEQDKNVEILINQGGSADLYRSLKSSQKGDLYLPGSSSYRTKYYAEGLLGDFVDVGYNQAALIVKKGNPKNISADLKQLLRDDLRVIIGNAATGSIGRETKRILDLQGSYQQVLEKAVFLTTDSRNLNSALRSDDADLVVNWKATGFFKENREHMQVIDIDPSIAKPKKLQISQLNFSSNPEIGRYFMDVATSERGQAIFRSYGFLDNSNE